MLRPEIHLIDGENLVFRYQDMLKSGRTPKDNVVHKENVYVWHPDLIGEVIGDIKRISLYTSATGDDDKIISIAKEIKEFSYTCRDASYQWSGTIYPQVFKKKSQGHKSRAVDINITIDALRHINNGSAGTVCIYSGDSDFLPLIEELMHLGGEVELKAFSSGLSPKLEVASDQFRLLDDAFFK